MESGPMRTSTRSRGGSVRFGGATRRLGKRSPRRPPWHGPHCHSLETLKRRGTTSLGYARFFCHACGRRFNERTGTLFNDLQYPTGVVLNAVLWRLRYKLSLRDVAELLLLRGFAVTHETVRQWEARFAPLLADRLREKRRGRRSVSWYLDETYVKVARPLALPLPRH